MFYAIVAISCAALLHPALSFMTHGTITRSTVGPVMAVATGAKPIAQVEAPDFYWQFRLDRLVSKKGSDLPYNAKNYPDSAGARAQYDAYYLDLTLQGKMENFNWAAEKKISDSEWVSIYKSIAKWTKTVAKGSKTDANSLPADDIDLLKQFYPSIDTRALETPFTADEVGANFPYSNLKELFGAAGAGKLNLPGWKAVTSLDGNEARAEVAALKEKSMKALDEIFADSLAFAKNSFPDEAAKKHYKELREKLATFPQSPAEWAKYRADFDKEVDEMARLAGKTEDEHHHHHDENHVSPAQEFEKKYGRNLDEMQERFNRYKADPEGFLEATIVEKYGSAGLSIWKKSQEFSNTMSTLSDAEKASTEKSFADFLKQA